MRLATISDSIGVHDLGIRGGETRSVGGPLLLGKEWERLVAELFPKPPALSNRLEETAHCIVVLVFGTNHGQPGSNHVLWIEAEVYGAKCQEAAKQQAGSGK